MEALCDGSLPLTDPETADGFTWHIENASFCPQDGIASPKVIIFNTEFCLHLYRKNDGPFTCRLTRLGSSKPIAYSITILTEDKTSLENFSGTLDFHHASPMHRIEKLKPVDLAPHCDAIILRCILWKTRRLVLTGMSTVTHILTVTQVLYKNYPFAPVPADRPTVDDLEWYMVDYREFENYVNFSFLAPMSEKHDYLYQWVRIRYRTNGTGKRFACMRARVSVMDLNGKVWKSSDEFTQWVDARDSRVRSLPNFVRHWEIARARKQLVGKDGCVRFKYEAEISFGGICNSVEDRWYDCAGTAPGTTLTQDILRAFLNQKYCDITLRCFGKSFSVHRCILCYRSSFFKRCCDELVHKTKNTHFDVACIDDGLKVLGQFQRLLLLIYTGDLNGEEMNSKGYRALKKTASKWKICLPPQTYIK